MSQPQACLRSVLMSSSQHAGRQVYRSGCLLVWMQRRAGVLWSVFANPSESLCEDGGGTAADDRAAIDAFKAASGA